MKHELRLFLVAVQFLTRVPVPRRVGFDPAWLQACVRHFPLVGALVGGWAALVLWAALQLWPPLVASTLSLIATVWLTGAFHEDGLADTCDALGGAVDRERALAIMKDSRIGSYGAVALVLALVLKILVVASLTLDVEVAVAALVVAHAVSRAAPVFLIRALPYAGDAEHAKARPLATRVAGTGPSIASAWVALIAVSTLSALPDAAAGLLASLAAAAVATLLIGAWLRRRLGGFTGDALGAAQQIVEGVVLLAWLAAFDLGHA